MNVCCPICAGLITKKLFEMNPLFHRMLVPLKTHDYFSNPLLWPNSRLNTPILTTDGMCCILLEYPVGAQFFST